MISSVVNTPAVFVSLFDMLIFKYPVGISTALNSAEQAANLPKLIAIGVYTTEDIIVASEDQSTFQYITFGHTLYSSIQNNGVPCILNLTWVKDDNTEIPLIPAEVTFKRDTNFIITIKVDDSTTGTFNITPIPDYEFSSTEEIGIYGRPITLSNN